jgi:hypothetical protein
MQRKLFMSHHQNVEQNHNMKIGNKSLKNVNGNQTALTKITFMKKFRGD